MIVPGNQDDQTNDETTVYLALYSKLLCLLDPRKIHCFTTLDSERGVNSYIELIDGQIEKLSKNKSLDVYNTLPILMIYKLSLVMHYYPNCLQTNKFGIKKLYSSQKGICDIIKFYIANKLSVHNLKIISFLIENVKSAYMQIDGYVDDAIKKYHSDIVNDDTVKKNSLFMQFNDIMFFEHIFADAEFEQFDRIDSKFKAIQDRLNYENSEFEYIVISSYYAMFLIRLTALFENHIKHIPANFELIEGMLTEIKQILAKNTNCEHSYVVKGFDWNKHLSSLTKVSAYSESGAVMQEIRDILLEYYAIEHCTFEYIEAMFNTCLLDLISSKERISEIQNTASNFLSELDLPNDHPYVLCIEYKQLIQTSINLDDQRSIEEFSK